MNVILFITQVLFYITATILAVIGISKEIKGKNDQQ